MLDRIRRFVADLAQAEVPPEFTDDDHRVAAAALLIHIMQADGVIAEGEREALHGMIKDSFGLDDADADRLAAEAQHRDEEAIDLFAFTSVLKRCLDRDQRLHLIEMMWTMVFADGAVSEIEDNIVWRVAELLGIGTRDRVLLKQRIADRLKRGIYRACRCRRQTVADIRSRRPQPGRSRLFPCNGEATR